MTVTRSFPMLIRPYPETAAGAIQLVVCLGQSPTETYASGPATRTPISMIHVSARRGDCERRDPREAMLVGLRSEYGTKSGDQPVLVNKVTRHPGRCEHTRGPASRGTSEPKLARMVDQTESVSPATEQEQEQEPPRNLPRRGTGGLKQRYSGSSAEHLWNRLNAMDFINKGMLFAAILLLCFFPFLIIINALAGRSAVTGLTRHLGLNQQAALDVSHLFASSTSTSSAVTGTAYVFFVLGGIAAATAVQDLYERAFDLEARGMKDILRRILWLGVVVGGAFVAGWAGPWLSKSGGPVLLGLIGLVVLTLFWWFTMWFLLARRISWPDLLPSAIATGIFWIGMEVVFSFIFSNIVISDDKKYGSIGVVFALMSWLIAIGVVIILGAVAGVVWRERGLSLRRSKDRTAAQRPQ